MSATRQILMFINTLFGGHGIIVLGWQKVHLVNESIVQ